jgi:hypothetical protein
VTFQNNGNEVHTLTAQDGSWTTGPLLPRETVVLTFEKPGTYLYQCKEHPWSYGELTVVDASFIAAQPTNGGRGGAAGAGAPGSFAEHARLGNAAYLQNCSTSCHGADLSGNDPAPALAGSTFLVKWQGRSADDLFNKIRTTMPPTGPASLSQESYLDIVAYILQTNEIPAGNRALSADTLKSVSLSK